MAELAELEMARLPILWTRLGDLAIAGLIMSPFLGSHLKVALVWLRGEGEKGASATLM